MKNLVSRSTLVGAFFALLASSAWAQSPTFSLWLVEVNDVPCTSCPTQNVPAGEVNPGDTIRVEAYVEGWDDNIGRGVCSGNLSPTPVTCTIGDPVACNGTHCSDSGSFCNMNSDCNNLQCVSSTCVAAPRAGTVQWSIDCASYVSGSSGELSLARIPCDPADCEVLFDGTCPCAQFYQFSQQCTCATPDSCAPDNFCGQQGSAFIETARPDYLLFQQQQITAVATTSCQEWASTMLTTGGVVDPGPGLRAYIGTLMLDVSPDASGVFTLEMFDDPNRTFLLDSGASALPTAEIQDLVINIAGCCPGTNCNDNNLCTMDQVDCNDCSCDNTPVSCPVGQACNPVNGNCETVVNGICTSIVSANPPDCSIDARQPHDINNVAPPQGFTSVDLTLSGPANCTVSAANLTVTTTPGPGPTISNVVMNGSVATVTFSAPVPAQNWTCVRLASGTGKACLGLLPADANGNRTANAQDITALINSLNNVPGQVRPLFATDANRNGTANAQDITQLINLLNGAAAFNPWINQTIPACPP